MNSTKLTFLSLGVLTLALNVTRPAEAQTTPTLLVKWKKWSR
jgi:hypothetical protein